MMKLVKWPGILGISLSVFSGAPALAHTGMPGQDGFLPHLHAVMPEAALYLILLIGALGVAGTVVGQIRQSAKAKTKARAQSEDSRHDPR